jgi:hypothetical protein
VLKKLSTQIPGAAPLVSDELLLKHGVLKRAAPWDVRDVDTSDEEAASDDDGEEDSGTVVDSELSDAEDGAGASRLRFEICAQCGKEYDVLENGKRSCRWHDGESIHTFSSTFVDGD